jgi:AbrB family looped-hinge helix DNA binding protein
MNAGQVPGLKSTRKAAQAPDKKVVVGKRGSLVIPKALVEVLGLQAGDGFVVRKTKAGISLKKA